MLDEHCGDAFSTASQIMIDSAITPPKVKEVFKRFQSSIDDLHSCFRNGNVKCIKSIFSDIGIPGTREILAESTGELHKLTENSLKIDLIQHSKIEPLKSSDGKEATQILCDLLNIKAKLMNEFIEEHGLSKV